LNIQISQGSVATDFRRGDRISYSFSLFRRSCLDAKKTNRGIVKVGVHLLQLS